MKAAHLKKLVSSTVLIHLALAGITLAMVAGGWWAGQYLQSAQAAAGERQQAALELLGRAERLRADWKSVQDERSTIDAEVVGLLAKLPEREDEGTFLQQLSDLAARHDVSLSEFRPGGRVQLEDHREIELRLKCSGKYSDLCHWLASVQQLPRMSRVSQLTVNAPRTANGDCSLDCQLNLLFGLKPDKSSEGALP